MQKVLTIKRGDNEVRTVRVFLAVTHQRLDAAIEAAVLAAIDAYRGPEGERVVHMADGRNFRRPDVPLPGTITRDPHDAVDDFDAHATDADADEEGDAVL